MGGDCCEVFGLRMDECMHGGGLWEWEWDG